MPPDRQSRSPALTRRTGDGRVVVVGAGVGGLACAIELAAAGREVVVVERAEAPGGKLREVAVGRHRLDAGPTVFTMRWVFDALCAAAGTTVDAELALDRCEVLARHAWPDGSRLDLHADAARSEAEIAAFAGGAEAARFRAFCARAAEIYSTLEGPFLRSDRPSPMSLVARAGWRGLPGLMRISPFATMWSALGQHFHDPRLHQLFGRYATYCGSSPFDAPATLMLVAHVEQAGVWRVRGGMHAIAASMQRMAERHGAVFRFGSGVREIVAERGRARGVRLDDGDVLEADAVVFNGDVSALGTGLLGADVVDAAPAVPAHKRSLSAVTWNIVGLARGFPLVRHNVFFGADCADEFAAVFDRGTTPADPTVYVCAQDRGDGESDDPAATAGERLFCLVNAPASGDSSPMTPPEVARCSERMRQVLARAGLSIEAAPANVVTTTPTDFARLFPATGGALYGQASHGWAASFSRPGARSKVPGLYLAGGSVHPGPGVPMAALSGRLAAASVQADRSAAMRRTRSASTSTSRAAATPGGTSMP